MKWRKSGANYILAIDKGEIFLEKLIEFCQEKEVVTADVKGIGALKEPFHIFMFLYLMRILMDLVAICKVVKSQALWNCIYNRQKYQSIDVMMKKPICKS